MLIETIIITLSYTVAIFLIFMYALAQLNLLFNYLSSKRKKTTVQLLILITKKKFPWLQFNLLFLMKFMFLERLDNISKLKYPRNKLEIQVLDDSTDESVDSRQLNTLKSFKKKDST